MADGCQGSAPAAYSGADVQGAGTMARHLAPSPRLDSFGYGASFGTGSSHHWTMGRRLWRGWACRLDFRAVRGVPSALCEAQQSELRAAVQELPAMAGIELANWKLKVIWDNAPAHRGEGVREYLRTPGLELRLLNLPGTARTSMPMRLSGAGRERRPLAICAWEAGRQCRRGSANSWPG